MSKLKLGLNEVSNAEYHGDLDWYSSSSYKMLLDDPATFYKKHILKETEKQEEKEHFQDGSFLHSNILEPHLVDQEYAFFPGLRKAGNVFEAFKAQNPGKVIISKPQKERGLWLYNGYKKCKEAVRLIEEGGASEVSVCQIYKDLPTKVRADRINVEKGHLIDVKTSAFDIDKDSVRLTIDKWSYLLSASLYLEIFEQFYGRKLTYYWIFVGKKDADCKVYRLSEQTREEGLIQVNKAIAIYKNCVKTGDWTKKEASKHYDDNIEEI